MTRQARFRTVAATMVLAMAGLYAWRHTSMLSASWHSMQLLPPTALWLAVGLLLLTFLLAAVSYRLLVLKQLALHELIVLELAAAAVNRLVPAGLGGLGMHGWYLHRRQHTVAEATAVVSMNNLLGMIVHVLMLTAVLATGASAWPVVQLGWSRLLGWLAAGTCLVVGVLALRPLYHRISLFGRHLQVSLRRYTHRRVRVAAAVLTLALLTLINVLLLVVICSGLGIHLTALQLFVAYSVAVLLATLVPTPGGLVGAEAGLTAGLAGYGVPVEQALAAALTFRAVTYWLPLVPGLLALVLVRRRHLV